MTFDLRRFGRKTSNDKRFDQLVMKQREPAKVVPNANNKNSPSPKKVVIKAASPPISPEDDLDVSPPVIKPRILHSGLDSKPLITRTAMNSLRRTSITSVNSKSPSSSATVSQACSRNGSGKNTPDNKLSPVLKPNKLVKRESLSNNNNSSDKDNEFNFSEDQDPITSSILKKLAAKRTCSKKSPPLSPPKAPKLVETAQVKHCMSEEPKDDSDDDAEPKPLFVGNSKFMFGKHVSNPEPPQPVKVEPIIPQSTTVVSKTYSFFKSKSAGGPIKKPAISSPNEAIIGAFDREESSQKTTPGDSVKTVQSNLIRKTRDGLECKERGDVQQFLDDLDYLLEGLASTNDYSTRVLTTLTLANKCLSPSFRDSLIAHKKLAQIAKLLADANQDFALSLVASLLFYIISRDRDPNSLDPQTLSVILLLRVQAMRLQLK
ncbi:hypothetical protein Ciccas_005930 [Cichlidogyrus casuarinus]|uniref:WAPL domain-containing protein n=1 Tax=Cichlidogyrus casuarinus TaxID=1844966 RepID=A0ABD2Q7K4_9PLAT